MTPPSPRRILLADADAFFVAVARLVDPEGAGRAPLLIVGGDAGSRGVVCSASYEARKFGVRSAMPMARAVKLCPRAMCVPVPRGACGRKSREIAAVLSRFAPMVQTSSIDEWYLDLGGTEQLFGSESLAQTAARIREAVLAETGLTVSFGGGTTKLVAKLAVELAKPHGGAGDSERAGAGNVEGSGVFVVPSGGEAEFMTRFKLAELPMVGPKFQERLERFGLRTVSDALEHDEASLVRLFGDREGRWLHQRIRGIDPSAVETREETKSISREETFARDAHDDDAIETELLRLVVKAAADLRQQNLQARTITVKLRDADFQTRQASRTLPDPVESERAIGTVARELLRRLRRARRVGARLVGVGLTHFGGPPVVEQLALFDAPAPAAPVETERDRRLSRVVDDIRGRYGDASIVPGKLVK
jgi:DNA polymerase-4